ncbi:hypothetical protein FHX80_114624 [Streptomyces brevispora]|uniref:TetR family transcriptional regulator n=1 Tax=Streptomyces brevispora TaxID=887462 RepID=A0A561V3D8_9ACTN|nr:hypothetical protein FHX80_114624 [Streptomyces brevispora]
MRTNEASNSVARSCPEPPTTAGNCSAPADPTRRPVPPRRAGPSAGRGGAGVAKLFPAMMMYRSKVCGSEWSDGDIAELIDQVAMPFFRSDSR